MRVLLLFIVVLASTPILANEWRQFRGPDGQGHAVGAKNLPTQWSESEGVIWKTEIPGRGWSSPVFAGPTIWLTAAVEHQLKGEELANARAKRLDKNPVAKDMNLYEAVTLHAIGINAATGRVEHNIELFSPPEIEPIHSLNSYASPSPVLDGHLLFCHFGEMGTACVDTETKAVIWKSQLPSKHAVGPGSSPIVFDDVFIVPCDGMEQQYVMALDKFTGKRVWRTNRPKMSGDNGDLHKSFSTPLHVNAANRDQVIVPGAQWVVSYDPRDGQEIWKVRYGNGFSNVPRPVVGHGLAYICTGFMTPQIWAVALDGTGDVSDTHVKFKITKQIPTISSPILVDDLLYFISDKGVATCADALTGEQVWTNRMSGNYSASPLYADGKLYFASQDGNTTIIKPGREYNETAVNSLNGQLMASPAVLDQSLLLRSQTHLYRIGSKTQP